jgi:hypothetical protein
MWRRFVTTASIQKSSVVEQRPGPGLSTKQPPPGCFDGSHCPKHAFFTLQRRRNVGVDRRTSQPRANGVEWHDFRWPVVHVFERYPFAVAIANPIPTRLSHGEHHLHFFSIAVVSPLVQSASQNNVVLIFSGSLFDGYAVFVRRVSEDDDIEHLLVSGQVTA